MPNPYIPPDDPGKLLWLVNFDAWLTANGAARGFSPAEIAAMTTETGNFSGALSANTTAQAAAQAATANKNTVRASAIALARAYAQRLQIHPAMTDAERAAAGITVPDTTPTPGDPNLILTIPPPLLLLDFGVRRQVTVHWGPNPGNELQNARPAGTLGCQVQNTKFGVNAPDSQWFPLEIDTESPILHLIDDQQPVTVAYRARYVGKNLKFGPFGDPAVCTVTP